MRIRPLHNLKVRFPEPPYPFLADAGDDVPESSYWFRKLVRGDVSLCDDIDQKPKSKPAKAVEE